MGTLECFGYAQHDNTSNSIKFRISPKLPQAVLVLLILDFMFSIFLQMIKFGELVYYIFQLLVCDDLTNVR